MKPAVIDVQICTENCPATFLLWTLKGNSLKHRLSSSPSSFDRLQSPLYVGKLAFLGPKISMSKINSLAIKAAIAAINTAVSYTHLTLPTKA